MFAAYVDHVLVSKFHRSFVSLELLMCGSSDFCPGSIDAIKKTGLRHSPFSAVSGILPQLLAQGL